MVWQLREMGRVLRQAVDSILPLASVPQAVACADFAAAASETADALAQFVLPLNSTQTSHSKFCAPNVEYSNQPTRPSAKLTVAASPALRRRDPSSVM